MYKIRSRILNNLNDFLNTKRKIRIKFTELVLNQRLQKSKKHVFVFLRDFMCIFAMNIIIKMKVDFQLQSEEGDIATFIANGEWALLGL